jgi:hypothetical protein
MLLVSTLLAASVSIQARVDDRAAAPGWVYARVGQKAVLKAVVTGAKPRDVRWFKLEPKTTSIDNTQPSFHFADIEYTEHEVAACRGKLECPADAAPQVLPAVPEVKGAGTLAWQVRVTPEQGGELKTPGLEAVRRGGLTRAVMRVTFRTDDTYLGYLSELVNTPYIFGSAGPDGDNQTDNLVGADCADFAVYGRRRMGLATGFTNTFHFDRTAPLASTAVALDATGVATDSAGSSLGLPSKARPGDVLHFPNSRHVAVLYEDREPLGVLDANDLMFHTCWAPPKIEPIGASSCASLPWRVLRFPEGAPRKSPP